MPSIIAEPTPTDTQLRDKEFSKTLHGTKATENAGYLAILKKDSEAQKLAASTYFQFWEKTANGETEEDINARSANYTDLVNAYYNLATDLYEYGWSQSFHFCRFYLGEGFHQVKNNHPLLWAYADVV
jgi:sterol 24-C-methyltransferase